jgi:GLPGLI family protein
MKLLLSVFSFFCFFHIHAQKRFSEGSILFNVTMTDNEIKSLGETTMLQRVKGGHYRSELTNEIGKTVTIYDLRDGAGAILKEFGTQKIMIPLNKKQWTARNLNKDSVIFTVLEESKEILGFVCKRAEAKKADGSLIVVYFTKEVVPENWDIELQFTKLGGLVLEYESIVGVSKINYVATSINFDPVPIQKFDLPQSGYRLSEYDKKQ